MTDSMSVFAASAVALYAAHHVGDYWVQTDHQARHKGDAGIAGAVQCAWHVVTYVSTQFAFLVLLFLVTGFAAPAWQVHVALVVSGVTHYLADRREHGIMFRIARLLPGKSAFLRLGTPREPRTVEAWFDCPSCKGRGSGGSASDESTNGGCWDCRGGGKLPSTLVLDDNPSLGTGVWALDQAWHIFFGVFVAALVVAA